MRRRLFACCLTCCLLLAAGCYDAREMNHLALVVAVGIDKDPDTGRYQVTAQIARPGSGKGARGGGGGDASGGAPVYIATGDGDTLFAAIRNLAQFVSRRIMWAHNNVIVVGEAMAREDLTPVMDFFTRNQELRMRTWLVVAKGAEARQIVALKTGMEQVPADSISALFRYAQLPGESVRSDVNEVAAAFFGPDVHPVIAAMSIQDRAYAPSEQAEKPLLPQAELAGTAIINGNRLVGYVRRETGRGLLWLRRQVKNPALEVPCPPGYDGQISIEVRSPRVAIRSYLTGNAPSFQVQVQSVAWLTEQDCATNRLTTTQLKTYVEQALNQKIKQEIEATLAVLQGDLKTDAIRFGRLVHIQHPQWWRANRDRWEDLFPKSKVTVTVQTRVPKMGLFVRPMRMHSP